MNIQTGFDAENSRLTLAVETNLLLKYYPNFEGLFNAAHNKPSGLLVTQKNENTAVISFPIKKEEERDSKTFVIMDGNSISSVKDIINKFVYGAVRKELKITEFLPLSGYPIGDMKNDVIAAIKAKRNFCIIDTYDNYLKQCKVQEHVYNQFKLDYGTDEYNDAAIMIETGEFDKLVKMYKPKLVKTSWI